MMLGAGSSPEWPHRISRLWNNLALDLRFGGFLGGSQRSRDAGATWVVNTDYAVMPQIFGDRVRPEDVLVDVGCGKGRVINWWLHQGYGNRMIGLELVPEVAERTRARLRKHRNITIVTGDAIDNLPAVGTLFYLFNPFSDEAGTQRFMDRFRELFTRRPGVRAFYYNPVFAELFRRSHDWEVEDYAIAVPGGARVSGHARLCQLRLSREGTGGR